MSVSPACVPLPTRKTVPSARQNEITSITPPLLRFAPLFQEYQHALHSPAPKNATCQLTAYLFFVAKKMGTATQIPSGMLWMAIAMAMGAPTAGSCPGHNNPVQTREVRREVKREVKREVEREVKRSREVEREVKRGQERSRERRMHTNHNQLVLNVCLARVRETFVLSKQAVGDAPWPWQQMWPGPLESCAVQWLCL